MAENIHMKVVDTLERTSMMSDEIATTVCGMVVSGRTVAVNNSSAVTCTNCIRKLNE